MNPGIDDGPALRPDALLALGWQASTVLAFGVSLESIFAGANTDDWRHVLGIGLSFTLGDVRLGLAAGIGTTEATKAHFGAAFGRLVIDVGLPR